LRQCEFFVDRIVCRDSGRKFEIWLDGNLLPGLQWDLTWNDWKHWLKSPVHLDASFVRTTRQMF
jgi:hypothetical protein